MSKILNKVLFLLICAIPTWSYANYTITPVKVHIKPGAMMSSLTVHNNNDSSRHFQIRVYKVDKHKATEEDSKDLVVSPSMFKSGSKKAQIVRVAIKNPAEAFKHQHYVLSIKELPHGEVEANTVKIVTDFRVPVLIGDDANSAEAKAEDTKKE